MVNSAMTAGAIGRDEIAQQGEEGLRLLLPFGQEQLLALVDRQDQRGGLRRDSGVGRGRRRFLCERGQERPQLSCTTVNGRPEIGARDG